MFTIAIIEDNLDYASLLAEFIQESNGFYVDNIYCSVEDAFPALSLHTVDMAIVDIELKGRNGIWLMQQLLSSGSRTKFLVLSGHHDDETIMNALNAGASGYLLKTESPARVLEALYELSKAGAPMSSTVSSKLLNCFLKLQKKATGIFPLSSREHQIMQQLSRGLLYKEIGVQLGIEKETVKKHLSRIYAKLNVQNKIEAMNKFFGN